MPNIQQEKFLVIGKGCIIFPFSEQPTSFFAAFVHSQGTVYPSCNPPKSDILLSEIVSLQLDFGLQITWEVSDIREIKWVAEFSS